ncbi:proto-oncogene tyrosine-protein kinase receptor Ret-like isoform X1 [Macrobrachium rosenbergii]|uniref:proto-oncogene tyrosine-protein kinase receptor Ret-like isoform X1 n=1 Tax=Macrobrachium rosenbergii TaxID=79674 RepID=UPI0034D65DE5
MIVRLLASAILLTVVGPSSPSPDQFYGQTSWNGSIFTVKIPRNFPVDIPIFSLVPLVPPEDPDEESSYAPPPPRPIGISASSRLGSGFGRDGTLAELRLPDDAIGMDNWGDHRGVNSMGRGIHSPHSPREGNPPRMILLDNPNNLFQSVLQDQKNVISLRLRRAIELSDYTSYSGNNRIEVNIGPEGTQLNDRKYERRDNIITVRVVVLDAFRCRQIRKNFCMFSEDELKLRQWENRPRNALVSLATPTDVCPELNAKYSLELVEPKIGEKILTTAVDRLSIKPTVSLDREKYGSDIRFIVKCEIEVPGRRPISQTRSGSLLILDEDDSPPIRSRNPVVVWHYTNRTEDLDDQMMVLDPDLMYTNKYEIKLIGNTYNLVRIESINKFNIRSEECNREAENITGYTFSMDCTLLTPDIKMKVDANGNLDLSECREHLQSRCEEMSLDDSKMRKNVPNKIQFSVVIIDKKLLHRDPKAKQVSYDIVLTLPSCEEEAIPTWTDISVIVPPAEYNITVTRPVNKYYRLGKLLNQSVPVNDNSQELPSALAFVMDPESRNMGVAVTRVNGILYVEDPDMLTKGELIVRRGDTTINVYLNINIMESDPCPLPEEPSEEVEWCSSKGLNTTCEASCGLGSSGYCSWRPSQDTPNNALYGTCSPDLDTCPNGVCDELEQLHLGICPQDCVEADDFAGKSFGLIGPEGRGVQSCRWLFTCNEGKCVCFPSILDPDYPGTMPIPSQGTGAGCDEGCLIAIIMTILFFLMFLFVLFFMWRRRAHRSGKQKGGVISLGALPIEERNSLAYTRDEPHDTVHHGIRSSPRPEHNFIPTLHVTQIDRKWEFPRNRLVIEQTLGEGEFGKVMRAKAQGINGTLGYTTVAVKMLKPNSTPSELNDLLSEYSLLKEVSHPNVVKLLGACTLKGGPIYIIIEYCQYGSLRNYLKRSRHAEFENRVGSGPVEGTAADYNVTPKDILSFAWQISKGMAYLADMKLVHRDLAARNVLLAAGKVCKISDFGLTRDVYEGDLYFKRSKGRVPVKWMALESLVDHVYTSKSDVWGFGVLLWELVTLGTLPYPGVQPERLFTLLKAGYRMERPENCSQELYDVMLQCWAEDPNRRPCFQDLTDIFEGMIQADVEYLELRSLIVTNRSYFDQVVPLPDPPQQFQDAPPQIQVAPEQLPELGHQFQDNSETSPDSSPQIEELQNADSDWSPPSGHTDADSYLIARTDIKRPCREESSEPLLASITPSTTGIHTPTITTSHAHNPAYSPTSEMLPQPLHYSTLASRPDEEDVHTLECCRSEEDSDSGRATGDSGYATEEGRGRWKGDRDPKGTCRAPLTSPRGSSYSPLPHHSQDPDDDQDTSEDLEERQELLNEDLLGHLTPSPEPAYTAHHSTRTAHTTTTNTTTAAATHATSHAAHNAHTTPVIV